MNLSRVLRSALLCPAFVVALGACDVESPDDPLGVSPATIINGTTLNAENSGFVKITGAGTCSGTLITNEWVLTARHCVGDDFASVPSGATLTMGSQTRTAKRFVRHPSLDVALVRASSAFTMDGSTSGYRQALYDGSMAALVGAQVNCSGYGRNTFTGGSGTLRTAVLPVTGEADDEVTIGDNASQQVPWKGDSGSSCIFNVPSGLPSVIGVASTCSYSESAQVVFDCDYVSIASTREWIQSQILSGQRAAAMVTGDFNGDGKADIAVGAPDESVSGTPSGRVNIYKGTSTGPVLWLTLHQSSLESNEAGDRFGAALAAGDFDGDGVDDLAVGAPEDTVGGARGGLVFVFRGLTSGMSPWSVHSQSGLGNNEDGDEFGAALAAGDFNGDGKADLAIGAPGEAPVDVKSGYVFVLKGATAGLSAWSAFGQDALGTPESIDLLGASLAAGDFDGDGKDDLAVGASGEALGADGHSGAVFVYRGTTSGLAGWKLVTQTGLGTNEKGDLFGWALATSDFNGDGKADLAVGVPGEAPASSSRAGSVFVFKGSSTGPTSWTLLDQSGFGSNEVGDFFGGALAAGDFNADGKADLAVGAPGEAPFGGAESGWTTIFRGGATAMTFTQQFGQSGLDTDEVGDFFGGALAAGDLNGDGLADLTVGAPGETTPGGPTYVFKGLAAGLDPWVSVN